MSADDILYSPLTPAVQIDTALIQNTVLAMNTPSMVFSFNIDPVVSLATFHKIADIIQADRVINLAAQRTVTPDPSLRPSTALDAKRLFSIIHADPPRRRFYWTAKGSAAGVEAVELANVFSIIKGMPAGRLTNGYDYEWWALGIMSQFAGRQGFYIFDTESDAETFWKMP